MHLQMWHFTSSNLSCTYIYMLAYMCDRFFTLCCSVLQCVAVLYMYINSVIYIHKYIHVFKYIHIFVYICIYMYISIHLLYRIHQRLYINFLNLIHIFPYPRYINCFSPHPFSFLPFQVMSFFFLILNVCREFSVIQSNLFPHPRTYRFVFTPST